MTNNWTVGLCEIGTCTDCLLSFICPQIATAYARSYMDDSPLLFNICCLNPVAARWMIRTAYEINGDENDDICVGCCCICCSVNQMLQTSKKRLDPTKGDGNAFLSIFISLSFLYILLDRWQI